MDIDKSIQESTKIAVSMGFFSSLAVIVLGFALAAIH